MHFAALGRLQRHARRVGEIAGVLAKYGLAEGLRWLDVDWVQNHLRGADGRRLREQPLEARIRLALTELGTTFIKLGQLLSTRPDLVGTALADELATLQAATPADPPEVVAAALGAEFGRPPAEMFADFEPTAFASASIAQVHRATLFDGEAVVVKLMKKGVREQAATDLEILQVLARLAERHAAFLRPYQPALLARQFQRTLRRELDFTYERKNLEQFARAFAGDASVCFPRVVGRFCTSRVLTMQRLDGVRANDVDGLHRAGTDPAQFARRGANVWLEMIFRDGCYHADPHPGNLLALPGGVVGVLDCGMVGRLDQGLREEVEDMLFAAVDQHPRALCEAVLRVGNAPPGTDRAALQAEIDDFLDDYVHHSLADLDVGRALATLLDIVRRYHVVLPAQLSLLLRTVIVLEGTSRALDRDFSLAELVEPIYRRTARRRLSPRYWWRRVRSAGRDWERLLRALPYDLVLVLDTLRAGTLRVQFAHRNLDRSVNRLTLGLVVAALIVGSSALWSSAAPPLLGDVSLLGLVGYVLAALLGVRLWRSARRGDPDDDRAP